MIAQVLPPAELGLGDRPLPRISVFMSVFNCHVNRSPVAGRIDRIAYRPGTFINAELDKASEDNERNSLVISTPTAGSAWSRSPAWWRGELSRSCGKGQSIGAGERFGLIRFGSRLDVYLPEGTQSAGFRGPDGGCRRDRFWPISVERQRPRRSAPINHRPAAGKARGPPPMVNRAGACYIVAKP